jgi:hypothetical protein
MKDGRKLDRKRAMREESKKGEKGRKYETMRRKKKEIKKEME